MTNEDVAKAFREIARLLELRGESPFQVRAYARAADRIEGAGNLADLAREGRLTDLPGVGKAIADKIGYFLATGTIPLLEELRREIPEGVVEMSRLPGLGPGRIRTVREELGVDSVETLERAIEEGRLAGVKGFGPKTVDDLRRAVAHRKRTRSLRLHRAARGEAEEIAALLLERGATRAEPAGEVRRWRETVGALVLVAGAEDPELFGRTTAGAFGGATFEEEEIRFSSPSGLPVRVRVATKDRFGALLVRETGAEAHVRELESLAEGRGFSFGAEGLERNGAPVATPEEEDFFRRLGLPPIPPEVREGKGEIGAAAEEGRFPELIDERDLRGAVHVHSTWSDGVASVREMAAAAMALGFEYIGIADHSRSAGYAGGLSPERLLAQGEEIRKLNRELAPFRVFHGVESDILADGSLDYDDPVLETLDFVVASIHSRFGLGREEQTARLVAAVRNRQTTVLGHPSGRLLLTREPYDFDPDAVWRAAMESGTVIELNAHQQRLDVDWREIGKLREMGVPLWIGADAHAPKELAHHGLAVRIARKGWIGKEHVVNTLPAEEFAGRIRVKRAG